MKRAVPSTSVHYGPNRSIPRKNLASATVHLNRAPFTAVVSDEL
ncbi:hypothetical protein ACNHUS_06245 [Actinomycetes bacterium M1A6_2h]